MKYSSLAKYLYSRKEENISRLRKLVEIESGSYAKMGVDEAGKQADIIILDAPNHVFIPYSLGSAPVEMVFKNGILVLDNGERTEDH